MSSSDGRRRVAGESAATAGPDIETAAAGARESGTDGQAGVEQYDPWFDPGPKLAGYPAGEPAGSDGIDHADIGSTTAEWFLPTGRAGLAPDSMMVAAEDHDDITPGSAYGRTNTSGAPPWAGESVGPAPATPPPWETGPWPGPRSSGRAWSPEQGPAGPGAGRPEVRGNSGQPPQGVLRSPRTILITGLVPLVVPGLVLGALGLGRSAAGDPARRAAVSAIVVSLIWAVVIAVVVVVASASGSSAGSCSYPAAVQQAYAKAIADLGGPAPADVRAADLSVAVSTANASAAATGQIPVRSALFSMAGDLEQARTDVVAGKVVPGVLLQRLAADGTALTRACPR